MFAFNQWMTLSALLLEPAMWPQLKSFSVGLQWREKRCCWSHVEAMNSPILQEITCTSLSNQLIGVAPSHLPFLLCNILNGSVNRSWKISISWWRYIFINKELAGTPQIITQFLQLSFSPLFSLPPISFSPPFCLSLTSPYLFLLLLSWHCLFTHWKPFPLRTMCLILLLAFLAWAHLKPRRFCSPARKVTSQDTLSLSEMSQKVQAAFTSPVQKIQTTLSSVYITKALSFPPDYVAG